MAEKETEEADNTKYYWSVITDILLRSLFYVCILTWNTFVVDIQEEGLISLGNLRSFTFRELQLATDNFSSKSILGTGGFGNVYRGKLGDGTLVAVKRLKDLTGSFGELQFRTELEMISLAVHRNLLRLIGYCATSSERLLVYPYMSNGSVASRLRGLVLETCFYFAKISFI